MNLHSLKYGLILNLKNIPGPSVRKKIVVIEADDYGGIRMPSLSVFQKMTAFGISLGNSRYNKLDTLEDKDDLEALFELLQSFKGGDGKPAVMSPFVNVANPDFEKMKANGYKEYVCEPFTQTLQKYGRSSGTMLLWKQGMEAGIFTPEFHGREHISVQPWLKMLQVGHPYLLFAADNGFVSVADIKDIPPHAQEFRPEFFFNEEKQMAFLHRSIIEGVQLFEKLFGYTPTSFAPANSMFHPAFEETVFQNGVKFLVVAHKNPTPGRNGSLTFSNFTFRKKLNKSKLSFYIRNCAFEPTDMKYKSIDITLKQIEAAFRWNKPAIISTHRVNFVGGLHKKNRDNGLGELKKLLSEIIKRWPDVEFKSTANMLTELKN